MVRSAAKPRVSNHEDVGSIAATMRDIFEDIFVPPPPDPTEAARRHMRPILRKRFYESAAAGESADGFAVLLDGKSVRTPARRALAAPTRALAEALAAEWNAQTGVIEPASMPLTRLTNAIVDAVADAPIPVAQEIMKYLGSDLLCYRAREPADLAARQAELWDPVLAWAQDTLGARFVLAQGVTHILQPDAAIAAAATAIPENAWRLGALSAIVTLTGSALIALALDHGQLSVEQAWDAAHVDEDWQMAKWGRDEIALARRAFRFAEMQAAATVLDRLG